jgi:polysaccharide export outer membrane protein
MKTHKNLICIDCFGGKPRSGWLAALAMSAALVCAAVLLSGCATETPLFDEDMAPFGSVKLTEGDTVVITFPGSTTLNTKQKIRRDGKIDLQLVGEVQAAGKTPHELEEELLKLYGPQLVLKQVTVSLDSSSYPVFVSGSVMHPGKIQAERPIDVLEAIMEAGGPDAQKANLRRVVVLRHQEGQLKRYVLNLKRVLDGNGKRVFYLRPSDIVWIPEKAF